MATARPTPPPAATRVLVLAGGDAIAPAALGDLPAFDLVIAADSGAHHASTLGLSIDLAVGDFDSVDPRLLATLEREAKVERHPSAKDKTDIELALDAALRHGATSVVVAGGGGGRLDHALGNLLVLAAPAYAHVEMSARVGDARIVIVRDLRRLHGAAGSVVSLLALGGPARGVRTTGLRYPLRSEDLHPGSTRGISNVFDDPAATVRLASGVLIAIQPGEERASTVTRPSGEGP